MGARSGALGVGFAHLEEGTTSCFPTNRVAVTVGTMSGLGTVAEDVAWVDTDDCSAARCVACRRGGTRASTSCRDMTVPLWAKRSVDGLLEKSRS